jgi:hypothetical protein
VKRERCAACEHSLLIATQVIRMVMCPQVCSVTSIPYIVNPCGGRLARTREGCSHVLFPYLLQLLDETGLSCGRCMLEGVDEKI